MNAQRMSYKVGYSTLGLQWEYLPSLAGLRISYFSVVHYYSLIAQQAISLSVALRDICLGCKLMQKNLGGILICGCGAFRKMHLSVPRDRDAILTQDSGILHAKL